ncbi:hypothetical protein FB451DRAFT_1392493 [Mycena latifolia]|nr:hypothetical protein FB451DRAFT_1392493 [Mycena latifolia]
MSTIASSTSTSAPSASSTSTTSTTTSSSVQFPGFPTGSRRPNASATSRQTQPGGGSGGGDSSGSNSQYYYLAAALAILIGALLIWRQCRVRRRRLRPIIAPQPSLSETKPCVFDAYLAEKEALGEKVGLWEYIMPLSVAADLLVPPQEQPARKGDAPAPSIARVVVLIAMPAPPVKQRSADNDDKNSDLPYLEIGTLETDLLHAR